MDQTPCVVLAPWCYYRGCCYSGDAMMDKTKWFRHTVAVPNVTRTVDCFTRNLERKVVRMEYTEMVHIHDVYRRVINGKPTDQLWHRGAKVG